MIVWYADWPTPSCGGLGTVFYIKSAGTYQPDALATCRLAACRQMIQLVHGTRNPMELWCYIGWASVRVVCLALTDTKQWVLFYLPDCLYCGRVYIESHKLARLSIQYFSDMFSPSALKREQTFIQYIKAVSILSSTADCLFCVMYFRVDIAAQHAIESILSRFSIDHR